MLSLAEELLLLALHEEKGTVRWVAGSRLAFCLAGALLMELILKKRLIAESQLLEVVNRTPTGEPIIDDILKMLDNANKVKPPHYWVSSIGRRIKPKKNNLLEALVKQGLLNCEEYKVLGIFPSKRYPMRDDRPKKQIISTIRTIILRRESPDLSKTMLISLIYTCALTNTLFDKEERKDARKQVKEIAKRLPMTKAIIKAIQGAQAAGTHGSAG